MESAIGIVLSGGAGALGIRLGVPAAEAGETTDQIETTAGVEADVDALQSAVCLVWRALLLWMLLLLLLGFSGLAGK